MKKIKYINNFTDGTGWAKAGTYNALALATRHEVYCEERKYNNNNVLLEDSLNELLRNTQESFDYTIHHVLPTNYVKLKNTINVGFLEVEATISNKQWLKNLKMMDLILVPDLDSLEMLKMSGIDHVKIWPHSFNYAKTVGYKDSVKLQILNGSFNFLFVGEFSVRKNIETLLRAFYTEFNHKETVNLVIKTSGNPKTVSQLCEHVKSQCRKGEPSKSPIVISEYLSEQDLISITRQCHAFVTASHGEAWCYPALESMACGLNVIYPYYTGIHSYAPTDYSVRASRGRCYGAVDAVEGLYTCQDLWTEIDLNELMKTMRRVYSNGIDLKNQSKIQNIAKKYDYRNAQGVEEIFG